MKKICQLISIVLLSFFSRNASAQLFGSDVKVLDLPITNQHNPDVDVAFNGWVYDAYAIDTGYVLRVSRDSGQTWTTIDEYSDIDAHVQHVKLALGSVGTDTTSIRVFLMVLENDTVDYIGQIYINTYDGYADSFIAQNFNNWAPDNAYQGIDIATDYKSPGVGANPYSVAAVYSRLGQSADSVAMIVSTDAGDNYTVQQPVAFSGFYYRNVSIAYGQSSSGSNGRYFMAWEEFDATNSIHGRIYQSRTNPTITSAPISPIRIDTIGGNIAGLARNPCISVSNHLLNNDSSSNTAIITFERDKNGDGSDMDILAAYNMNSHFSNYWFLLNIDSSTHNTLTPNVCFEPVNNNFYVTYFDSTNKRLPIVRTNFNITPSTVWDDITNNYANDSIVLTMPCPVLGIDPTNAHPVMTWAAPLVLNNVVLFDAQLGNQALAIKTTDITAANAGTRNRVDWRTATEDDGGTFNIERSVDGLNFTAIGKADAKGAPSNYTYWDDSPAAGMNYYRLKCVDAANVVSYTKVVSAFVKGSNNFSVGAYPNPVLSSLNIYISGQQGANGRLSLCDITGKVLVQQQVSGYETSIDMSRFSPGIYLARYNDDTHSEVIRLNKN